MLTRLGLLRGFLKSVESVFGSEGHRLAYDWTSEAEALCEELAAMRHQIEPNPIAASSRLDDFGTRLPEPRCNRLKFPRVQTVIATPW